VLYFKLRSYHWTVTGRQFYNLHKLFEDLYEELAEVVDTLAERLMAIGALPVLTLAEQLKNSRLKEDASPKTGSMVSNIVADLDKMTAFLRDLAREAERAQDVATMNLADGIADKNEKALWMLRAYLKQE
jgi:starvation-inducible DNA-binding protein